ncbi:MAG: zinc ribbon domain-containing protein [Myxococcales bacterium]|nr:zinc ribbon domain-containing protein [Myxococcales bacterium]
MAVSNCVDCGKTVSTSAAACPHCGRPAAPPVVKCPDCGNNVSISAKACPNCGRPFAPAAGATLTFPSGALRPQVQIAPVLGCPRCGSESSSKYRGLYLAGAIFLFPLGLVFLLLPKIGKCSSHQCGHTFEVPSGLKL